MDIRIRLSHKVFYEVNPEFAAILLAGFPERFEQVQVVKREPLTHKWSLGTSHYGGQKFLVLTTPVGEAVRYNGNPEDAAQHFEADYKAYLPIPENVLNQYRGEYARYNPNNGSLARF